MNGLQVYRSISYITVTDLDLLEVLLWVKRAYSQLLISKSFAEMLEETSLRIQRSSLRSSFHLRYAIFSLIFWVVSLLLDMERLFISRSLGLQVMSLISSFWYILITLHLPVQEAELISFIFFLSKSPINTSFYSLPFTENLLPAAHLYHFALFFSLRSTFFNL